MITINHDYLKFQENFRSFGLNGVDVPSTLIEDLLFVEFVETVRGDISGYNTTILGIIKAIQAKGKLAFGIMGDAENFFYISRNEKNQYFLGFQNADNEVSTWRLGLKSELFTDVFLNSLLKDRDIVPKEFRDTLYGLIWEKFKDVDLTQLVQGKFLARLFMRSEEYDLTELGCGEAFRVKLRIHYRPFGKSLAEISITSSHGIAVCNLDGRWHGMSYGSHFDELHLDFIPKLVASKIADTLVPTGRIDPSRLFHGSLSFNGSLSGWDIDPDTVLNCEDLFKDVDPEYMKLHAERINSLVVNGNFSMAGNTVQTK